MTEFIVGGLVLTAVAVNCYWMGRCVFYLAGHKAGVLETIGAGVSAAALIFFLTVASYSVGDVVMRKLGPQIAQGDK